jgi:CrcB protein
MKTILQYLAVGAAGFLGAVGRMLVGTLCGRLFGTTFPVGTLVINLSGSLLLGWFLAWVSTRATISETLRFAVAVGFVGSYTTFSTFMYESDALLRDGEMIKATINLAGSIVLGLLAVRFGMILGTR